MTMSKISLIQALRNAAKTVPLCKHAAEHIIELERSEKHTKAVLRVAEKDYQYQIKELKAQIKALKQDVAFYKCCTLSGEIPKDGSEPSAGAG